MVYRELQRTVGSSRSLWGATGNCGGVTGSSNRAMGSHQGGYKGAVGSYTSQWGAIGGYKELQGTYRELWCCGGHLASADVAHIDALIVSEGHGPASLQHRHLCRWHVLEGASGQPAVTCPPCHLRPLLRMRGWHQQAAWGCRDIPPAPWMRTWEHRRSPTALCQPLSWRHGDRDSLPIAPQLGNSVGGTPPMALCYPPGLGTQG